MNKMVYEINIKILIHEIHSPHANCRNKRLACVSGNTSIIHWMASGICSTEKKVLHKNVIGKMTKVEKRAISAWVDDTIAAITPKAPNSIPFSSIIPINQIEKHSCTENNKEITRMSIPAYIPRKLPPII